MSGTCCVAWGCSNRKRKGKSFHRFPKNEKRRKQWIAALKRDKFQVTEYSRICVPTIVNFPARLQKEQKHRKVPATRGKVAESSCFSNPSPTSQPTTINEGADHSASISTDHAYCVRSPRKLKRQLYHVDRQWTGTERK